MTSISRFDSQVQCEEKHAVTESEYDEAMKAMAEDEGDHSDSRFYLGKDGKVRELQPPPSLGRIGGFEL